MRSGDRSGGFTYLAVLLLVAMAGFGLASAAVVWSTVAQREKEAELLFVGNQYRQAIGSYYERSPGGVQRYPTALRQLVEDDRFPVPARHLRRLYPDPMTGRSDWLLITRPDGQIVGVASVSQLVPIKRTEFEHPLDRGFENARSYADWRFVHGGSGVVPLGMGTTSGLRAIPPDSTAAPK